MKSKQYKTQNKSKSRELIYESGKSKKTARSVSAAALLFMFMMLLAGCSDDLGLKIDNDDPGENFTGITLLVPDVENAARFGATRGDEFANTRAYDQAKEANFNTLYIAAVSKKDNSVQTFLKTSSNGYDETEGYYKYRVNLPEGDYKIYVVANLNRYTEKEGDMSASFADVAKGGEDAIRNLILNFTASLPLEPGFLPLACLAENVRVGRNASENLTDKKDSEGYINIPTGENIYLYADLEYLCSKVRYTILFDRNSDGNELKNTSDLINFNRHTAGDYPTATNLRRQTELLPYNLGNSRASSDFITESSGEPSEWALYLDRYAYPKIGNANLNKTHSSDQIKEAVSDMTVLTDAQNNEWNTTYKDERAWQGITYLPENLLAEEAKKTVLKFPYTFNGNPGAYSPRKIALFNDNDRLERAKQYDVVVFVNSADPEQWTLSVSAAPWTLQELAYQLHGPYELVVETSVIDELSMEDDAVFWFRSDVPPQEIGFESPQVSINNNPNDPASMRPLFKGKVMTNPDGSFARNDNGDYLYQVGLNSSEIPYSILQGLDKNGITFGGVTYTKEDISYFHIVAGSLHKRVEIKKLNLEPYLKVTPQTFIVDTRELYTSGYNDYEFEDIVFETNVDVANNPDVILTVSDPSGIIGTLQGSEVLKVLNPSNYRKIANTDQYNLTDKTGIFTLRVEDIISGNTYWNENNEYTLTFSLTTPELADPIQKIVTIKVKPFTGSYVIHFRDNTKNWEDAHIYVYQLLTLPSDLPPYDTTIADQNAMNTPGAIHKYAGRIVGYIEPHPNSGLQWNAAAQYVFSNNLSFRGWKGYGGPDINNPWEEAYCTYTNPSDYNNSNHSTMGFVMFGQPEWNNAWNYSYCYTSTDGVAEDNRKFERYNYNVNFNGDHEGNFDRWGCQQCKDMSPDYNDGDNKRFYPGITMEKEADGWWKYTLTGVAQPGRTMIIFANWHKPWEQPERDYRAEDYRWPGDYETGLPLFDFEDNEGWFLFDGNTSNSNQKFTDNKPSNIIPHNFTSAYTNKLRIGVKSNTQYSQIIVDGETYTRTTSSGGIDYYDAIRFNSTASTINVIVNGKTYKLSPKNFKLSGGWYVTAQPLYTTFDSSIKMFVKWSDAIKLNEDWGKEYAYYQPPTGGSPWLSVRWGSNSGAIMNTFKYSGKEYGNYKNVTFNFETGSYDKVSLRLCTTSTGTGDFYKILKVEDLPQYYNPTEGYYQINWHLLKKPE